MFAVLPLTGNSNAGENNEHLLNAGAWLTVGPHYERFGKARNPDVPHRPCGRESVVVWCQRGGGRRGPQRAECELAHSAAAFCRPIS